MSKRFKLIIAAGCALVVAGALAPTTAHAKNKGTIISMVFGSNTGTVKNSKGTSSSPVLQIVGNPLNLAGDTGNTGKIDDSGPDVTQEIGTSSGEASFNKGSIKDDSKEVVQFIGNDTSDITGALADFIPAGSDFFGITDNNKATIKEGGGGPTGCFGGTLPCGQAIEGGSGNTLKSEDKNILQAVAGFVSDSFEGANNNNLNADGKDIAQLVTNAQPVGTLTSITGLTLENCNDNCTNASNNDLDAKGSHIQQAVFNGSGNDVSAKGKNLEEVLLNVNDSLVSVKGNNDTVTLASTDPSAPLTGDTVKVKSSNVDASITCSGCTVTIDDPFTGTITANFDN